MTTETEKLANIVYALMGDNKKLRARINELEEQLRPHVCAHCTQEIDNVRVHCIETRCYCDRCWLKGVEYDIHIDGLNDVAGIGETTEYNVREYFPEYKQS